MSISRGILLLFAISAIAIPEVLGCTCVTAKEPRVALTNFTSVFHGRVYKIEHLRKMLKLDPKTLANEIWIPERNDLILVSIEIDASWKGNWVPTIDVFAIAHPEDCDGFVFEIGSEYTIFADQLTTSIPELADRVGDVQIVDVGLCPGPIIRGPVQLGIKELGRPKHMGKRL